MPDAKSKVYKSFFDIPLAPSYGKAIKIYFRFLNIFIAGSAGIIFALIISFYVQSPKISFWISVIPSILLVSLIIIIIVYHKERSLYVRKLTEMVFRLRNYLLRFAEIEPENFNNCKIEILGIANMNATVNLVLAKPNKNWLEMGSTLDVVASATNDCWGTIKVVSEEEDRVLGFPISRINPDFWEDLEDRMKRDQSPPLGVHIEPHTPPSIKEWVIDNSRKD